MNELLNLPFELQIVLVAGFFAQSISDWGLKPAIRPEQFLLKILAFGLIARSILLIFGSAQQQDTSVSSGSRLAFAALSTISLALVVAFVWRRWLADALQRFLLWAKVHSDDLEPSAWASLHNTDRKWHFIQIELADGSTLESAFALTNNDDDTPRAIVNDDGIAIYVTNRYRPDGTPVPQEFSVGDDIMIVTYIPKEQIVAAKIGWSPN